MKIYKWHLQKEEGQIHVIFLTDKTHGLTCLGIYNVRICFRHTFKYVYFRMFKSHIIKTNLVIIPNDIILLISSLANIKLFIHI